MKRITTICLLAMLLLSACGVRNNAAEPTPSPETTAQAESTEEPSPIVATPPPAEYVRVVHQIGIYDPVHLDNPAVTLFMGGDSMGSRGTKLEITGENIAFNFSSGCHEYGINPIFVADINNDGIREICARVMSVEGEGYDPNAIGPDIYIAMYDTVSREFTRYDMEVDEFCELYGIELR